MILDTIKTNTTFKVEVKNLTQHRIPNNKIGFLKYVNQYNLLIDEKLYIIEIIDKSKLDEIDFFALNRNYPAIVNVIESIRDNFATIEIIFFSYPIQEVFIPFYIDIDEKIMDTAVKKQIIKYKDIDKLRETLQNKISFKINNENYFLVATASSSEQEIFFEELSKIGKNIEKIEKSKNLTDEEKEKYIKENKQNIEIIQNQKKNLAFAIYGENIQLPIKKEITNGGKYRFKATKLVSYNTIKKDALKLIKGVLKFEDGLISSKIANDLGDIVEQDDSYLKAWDTYLEKEGELLLNQSKQIGVLKILDANPIDNGYELKIENLSKIEDLLNIGDYLNFVTEVPNYIKNNLTWNEYIKELEELEELGNYINKNSLSFEITNIEHGFINIKTDKYIENIKNYKIVLSIYGDEVQLKRKLKARKRLKDGKSAHPILGLIIEDSDSIKKYLNPNPRKKLDPLTDYVQNKVFKHGQPQQNQIEAIDIALNTPDIAIIQGPPGTGKTTVLTAIIERLNEESNKENMKGQILVAGFQHDAVENIIERLEVNGIPTPKFGKKSTNLVDMNSYDRIIKWSQEIVERLKIDTKLHNQIKINKLNQYFEVYLKTPSKHLAINLLQFIIDELSIELDSDIVEESKNILKELNQKQIDIIEELKYIYALRTTKEGFLDDGKERNLDLLFSTISKSLTNEEKQLLQQETISNIDKYIEKLVKLKYALIDKLYPKPIFRAEKPNSEIIKLKDKVELNLKDKNNKDKINQILADYLNELECNPFGLKSMIEEYSYVYSSTTGQSNQASKQKMENEDEVSFDTVIIDEAARVTPMDLLVAMVLAKRRIILVGDHRQLPHMVDEDVIKDANLSENEFINESIFGYLKKRAETLKNYDNITRSITLKNQYRTHPLLGNFVSDNFYKKYNEDFESPLGTEIGKIDDFFKQELEEIKNTPAVWIDVPNKICKEERAWSRRCEAVKIVEYLKKWSLSKEGENLSFGIITFYRKQKELLEELIKQTFTQEEINMFKEKDRLKIGTVDSFQGMEFDIVFLSIVRSKDIKNINDSLKDYNLFGFLISKNRLCVSMSRQKRSLIVVGDKQFFETNRAKTDVEELYNFLQLCKSEGKVL